MALAGAIWRLFHAFYCAITLLSSYSTTPPPECLTFSSFFSAQQICYISVYFSSNSSVFSSFVFFFYSVPLSLFYLFVFCFSFFSPTFPFYIPHQSHHLLLYWFFSGAVQQFRVQVLNVPNLWKTTAVVIPPARRALYCAQGSEAHQRIIKLSKS